MKQLKKEITQILLLTIVLTSLLWSGTTGKIAGTITDKVTGEALIGSNVVVVGTSLGAAADVNGHYSILYIPPGTYKVQISFIGYETVIVNDVRVYIDQTAHVDAVLGQQTINAEEVIVLAERKTIKPDVATSVAAMSDKDVEALPATNVVTAIGLQAGVRGGWAGSLGYASQPSYETQNYTRGSVSILNGLSIRGGSGDNILFMVDGVTMRDPRNNDPSTDVALSAVQDISVERGGFNAEYGQVRSGVINVTTREGAKNSYFGSFQTRYSSPAPKYWRGDGILDLQDPNSYVLRPFFDPAVCWTGTQNGAWDSYTQTKYPSFMGWNAVSKALCSDNDPTNDLTPLGAQRAFEYETRKVQPNDQPDYNIDAAFGGPVPFVSKMLGDLRFFASYRSSHEELLFPLTRPDYEDYNWTLKLISDITPNTKLQLSSMFGTKYTMRHNWDASGNYFYPRYPSDIASEINGINSPSDLIMVFSDYNLSPSTIYEHSLAAKVTQTVNSKTIFEFSVENFGRKYNTEPDNYRDTSKKVEVVPGFYEDSNPFGYWPFESGNSVLIGYGMHVSKARDWTVVNSTTVKADLTSQVNFQNYMKGGLEFTYNDLNFNYGTITSGSFGELYSSRVQMHVFPVTGAAFVQDKLETKEFTANLGLRLDYYDPRSAWWDINEFDPSFFSSSFNPNTDFTMEKFKPQWQLSPRLGIAHPISENSKLFFNYGHFREVPQYESLFRVERNDQSQMTSFGYPDLILATTISYELGFDQVLFEDFLLQIAAYYNDISNEQDFTQYVSSIAGFAYTKSTSNHYQDTRGFEITLRKTVGRWVSGYANYTYQVNTQGHFGESEIFDNPAQQQTFNDATTNLYQDRPIPQPYARINLTLMTPEDWGPLFLGHKILGGWALNTTLDWQDGYWTTYNPKNVASIAYNVQAIDFYNTALRLDKSIVIGKCKLQLFMDINNVLNTLQLYNTGDLGYMESLHLPKNAAYDNIVGNDKVGDYRTPSVAWQPEIYQNTVQGTNPPVDFRAIYYESSTGMYWQVVKDASTGILSWKQVDQGRIDQINKDKAYINMPNASTFWFLNPRQIFFGVRFSINFNE